MARAKRKRTKTTSPKRPARARKRTATRKASPRASRGQSQRVAQLEAENRQLREELEALRAERRATPPAREPLALGEQTPLDL